MSSDIMMIFEPKTLEVEQFWLSAIQSTENGLAIKDLWKSKTEGHTSIGEAIKQIRKVSARVKHTKKDKISVPIWCFENPSPRILSAKALLSSRLSETLIGDIKSLELENPLDLTTHREGRFTETTIIDMTPDRILILGNPTSVVDEIRAIISRFRLTAEQPSELTQAIRFLLVSNHINPASSGILLGGLGTAFVIVLGILINSLISSGSFGYGHWFALIVCILGFASFLALETFGARYITFSPQWTDVPHFVAWACFLLFILVVPFFVVVDVFSAVYPFVAFISVTLILCCLVRNLGECLYEIGLTKPVLLLWWTSLVVLILLTPSLD